MLSRVRFSVTSWTVDYQAPPSMGFSSKSTGVGCHYLLQRIFPTQGSNMGLPHCRQTLYRLSQQGSLTTLKGEGELNSTWRKECQGIFKKHYVLLAIKKWNLTICDNMDELIYVKWNKSEKDNTVWFHLYVEFKKQNEWLTETVMQTAACQRGGWGKEWIGEGD